MSHLVKMTDANAVAGLQPKNSYGATVYNEYDELNRLTRTVDALNGETLYTYDLLGNVTSVTDAEGQTTRFITDGLGRLTEVVDPIIEAPTDKTVRFTLYDEAGNLLEKVDRKGRATRYTFDELNRLRQADYVSDGTSEIFTYDHFGDLTFADNGWDGYTFTYDLKHRVLSKQEAFLGRTLTYQYDDAGNVIRKTDYQGDVTEYRYDSTNRLTSERNQAYLQVSYHYDPAGRLLDRILSNGTVTSYRHDEDNRLIELSSRSAGGGFDRSQTYGRDRVGNITSITDSTGTATFTHDALYRLTDADYPGVEEDRAYTYDRVGNRTSDTRGGSGTWCYLFNNDGNRLDEVRDGSPTGPVVYRYVHDANGNRIEWRDGSGGTLIQSYTYDQKNRLTTLGAYGQVYHFGYDPFDHRTDKYYGTVENYSILEGEHLEAVYNWSDVIKAKYLRGTVVDEIVNGYHYDAQGRDTNTTFHHDHLQSVVGLSGHDGTELQTYRYDPFGYLIAGTGSTPNSLMYTGRQLDTETGLYYYRARYYDPEIGRNIPFLSSVNTQCRCRAKG